MKKIALTLSLTTLLTLSSIMAGLGQTAGQAFAAIAQGAYTPPVNSAERKAIADAYREKWKEQGGNTITDVVFVFNHLKVHNGWAWIEVKPQSSDGSQQYESEQGLLRKKSGKWRVMERAAGYDAQYLKNLKKKYPSMPADIFPAP